MKKKLFFILIVSVAILLSGCRTTQQSQLAPLSAQEPQIELSRELEDRILAMNPLQVTAREVKELLSFSPAPRVINIHGGIYPVHVVMESFSDFLVGMGYPETSVRNPGDGSYSFSCYDSSEKIAGAIAWYYEHEGLRPVMVGHSQGGMQVVKVLHDLAGHFESELTVWNPLIGSMEKRYEIREPLTGQPTPVVGLQVAYATAVGAGGLTRFMPNQWKMMNKLRKVPDSVVEFTGFYIYGDLLGGDLFGFSPGNQYESNGTAQVRNIRLPSGNSHFNVPSTRHLLKSHQIQEWINSYTPTEEPRLDIEFDTDSSHILWAADVWYSIKKHWVLELQRFINAQREQNYAY